MADCGVCISGGNLDGYFEMYEAGIVKIRKDHKCEECRRVIIKGQQCERVSGKWEGAFFAAHTCLDCVNIRDGLNCDGEPIALGALWESIDECDVFRNLTTGCLAKIETASAKAYLLERWRAWKGLSGERPQATEVPPEVVSPTDQAQQMSDESRGYPEGAK